MSDATNRALVEAWADATVNHDYDVVRRLAHPDFLMDWPQTGERIRGIEAVIGLEVGYPGGVPDSKQIRISGTDDRWVLDAFQRPHRITGSGEIWIAEARIRYASGEVWALVSIVELLDGRVRHETQYFAPYSDPPAWRAGLTEAIPAEPA